MMPLAFSTLACPNWTFEQAVAAAQRYGYAGIELRLLDGELLPPDLAPALRRRLRAVSANAGIPIVCVDTSVRIAQVDRAARETALRDGLAFLDIAGELESPFIRVFGGAPEDLNQADAIHAAGDNLTTLAERAHELGISVLLETHDAFATGNLVAQVLARAPNVGCGALWDMLHPYRLGESIAETLDQLGDRILHVHVKDGRPRAGGDMNWELTLLGAGAVPVREMLSQLYTRGYRGWLSLEWEKKWQPQIEEPEIALPQYAARLREYLAQIYDS